MSDSDPRLPSFNSPSPYFPRRVAFVSTRIAGTDGVSLEIAKWAEVAESSGGLECYYIAGECDRPQEKTILIEEMHFEHPEVKAINEEAFGTERRSRALTERILDLAQFLRERLSQAFDDLGIDSIIAENCLTIPMNIPLGVALVQVIQEKNLGCLAHHHDFYWERERFLVGAVDDFLNFAFPPPLPQIQHVVINSLAGQWFSWRTGISCRIVPNVMNFAEPPKEADDYCRKFREAIGVGEDQWLILQPTRVVSRKGIERAIELTRRLGAERAALVITHASSDEGDEYPKHIKRYAELLGVRLIFAYSLMADTRTKGPDGRCRWTIHDVYQVADLVAYPSDYEGFGNAFLEAVYYRRPVLCNRYAIYRTDIEPCGFDVVTFDGFLTDESVARAEHVLNDAAYREQMVSHNYRVAAQFFGYHVLEDELRMMIQRPQNIYRLIGRGRRGLVESR
jgi:mannosylglucosylglycerate synthase